MQRVPKGVKVFWFFFSKKNCFPLPLHESSPMPIGINCRKRVAPLIGANATRRRRIHSARGIKPGTPVSTTVLNLMFAVMPSRISRMASSGRADISKFAWI